MKTTHSLEQVEALMWKESNILRDPNVGKEAKNKARKRLKLLERHFADCNGKELNGKKYPERQKPVPISKKDLLALIDSVETRPFDEYGSYGYKVKQTQIKLDRVSDLSGVFISQDRTEEFPRTSILEGKFLKL